MKRIPRTLLTALAVVGSLVVGIAPAHAASTAYCPYGSVTGSISYVPALSVHAPLFVTTSWTLKLHMVCTGMAPSDGTYDLTINGKSTENCETGTGGGNVQYGGQKTNAGVEDGTIVGGGWTYTRGTVHYYGYPGSGDGNFTVVNTNGEVRTFTMYLWLDLVPSTTSADPGCPGLGGNIIGHGDLIEQ